MAGLRDNALPTRVYTDKVYRNSEEENLSSYSRGHVAAGISAEANEYYLAAEKAAIDGKVNTAAALKALGDEASQKASAVAPRIGDVREVRGLRDGAEWFMGNAGSAVRSTLPSIAGGIAGAIGGGLVAGPAGALYGGAAGAGAMSYNQNVESNAGEYINDAELAGKTPEERLSRARLVGAGQAALDTAGLGVTLLGRKALAKSIARKELDPTDEAAVAATKTPTVGGRLAEGFAAEAFTGGAQNVVGQLGKNDLAGNGKNIDWGDAAADAVAEGAGGFGFALPQALYQSGRNALTPEKVTGDPAADAGGSIGEAAANALHSVESALARRKNPIEADEDFINVTKPLEGSDDDVLAQLDARRESADRLYKKIAANKGSSKEQIDAATSYMEKVNQATTPQEHDALINEFSAALGGAVVKEKSKKSFFDAFQDWVAPPLDRKYNAMEPTDSGVDEDSDTVTPQILQLWQRQLAKDYRAMRADMNDPEVKAALMGVANWIKEGGRSNGTPLLPTSLTQALGSKSADAVSQLAQLMYDQGLIDARTKRTNERVVQHLNTLGKMSDRSVETVKAALTPLVKSELGDRVDDHARDMYMILSKLADGQLQNTEAGNAELLRQFGSQEKLNALLEAFKGETDERAALQEQYEYDLDADDEAGVPDSDTLDYEEKQASFEERESSDGSNVQFHGPFDLADEKNRERLSRRAENLAGQSSSSVTRTVGIWDKLKEENTDPDQLAAAEAELLIKHDVRVGAADKEGRVRALNLLNRRLRFVREEVADGRDGLDKIEGVTPFLDKANKKGELPDGSMQNGRIHLEFTDYETSKDIDPETGEAARVAVLKHRQVPVSKLIAHANKSGEPITSATGAQAVADKFMAALYALLVSGNNFTGRVKFIDQHSGREIVVEKDGQIPGDLMLLKGGKGKPPMFMNDAYEQVNYRGNKNARNEYDDNTLDEFSPSDFPNMTEDELTQWIGAAQRSLARDQEGAEYADAGVNKSDEAIEARKKRLRRETLQGKDVGKNQFSSSRQWLRDNIALAEDYLDGYTALTQSERDEKSINYKDEDRETLRGQDPEGVINRTDDGNVAVPPPSGALETGLSSKARDSNAPVLKYFTPSTKQLAWAVEQVKKSIPGLVAKVKDMTAIQGQAIRATLKYLVDNPQPGLNPATVERAYEKVIEVTQRVKPVEPQSISEKKAAPAKRETDSSTPIFDTLPEKQRGVRTMTYAGIGSRDTPPDIQAYMTRVAARLEQLGYTLRSGGAKGADSAFEAGATKKEIFYAKDATGKTRAIAKEIHPAPAALGNGIGLNLMARNTNQLFGRNLNTPVDFVLTWTKDGAESSTARSIETGGTGQAIDMASRKNIPVFNLATKTGRERFEAFMKEQVSSSAPEVRKANAMSTRIHEDLGKEGIAATHDSPIRHEGKFDWRAHRGAGEGHAAFGEGTYLSTADGVHRNYKRMFSAVLSAIPDLDHYGPIGDHITNAIVDALKASGSLVKTASEARADVRKVLEAQYQRQKDIYDKLVAARKNEPGYDFDFDGPDQNPFPDEVMEFREALKIWGEFSDKQVMSFFVEPTTSPTYHVTVRAKLEEILDWDAPLSEQSDLVKKALREEHKKKYAEMRASKPLSDEYKEAYALVKLLNSAYSHQQGSGGVDKLMTGQLLYRGLTEALGSQAKASDYLQSLGIVGHIYNAAAGKNYEHRNYVIYDDSRIETNYVSFNAQREAGKKASPETQAEVKAELLKILGDTVKVDFPKFVKMSGKKISGDWQDKLIRISLYAHSPNAVARHEAVHQLFKWLNEQGAKEMVDMLKTVASSAPIKNQLRRELKGEEAAIKQLDDPEEAAAYLYQFWREGKIDLGPKTETFFQKVAKFLQDIYSAVSNYVRDEQHAEMIMQAFTDGEFANGDKVKIAAYEKIIADRQREFGVRVSEAFAQNKAFKKFVFTAGNVMRDTKIPSIVELADQLYTQEGDAMNGQAYFDAVPQQRAIWLNKINRILKDVEKEDAAAALEFLQAETELKDIGDPVVRKVVADIRGFYNDIFDNYLQKKGVKRFNEDKGAWEPISKIKHNYFTRVWDADKIAGNTKAFIEDLMKSNAKEIESLAEKYKTTPEEIAQTVANRLLAASGEQEITESGSELGITPFAAAVNKRDLTWIDPANMKQWMNKDIASILTNYTVQAVKRAEYVERFGNEGEKIQQALDDGFLYKAFEGDEAKIAATKKAHKAAVAEHFKKGGKAENKPTLFAEVQKAIGFDAAVEIRENMKPVVQAIMAAEGTLGREIDAMMRQAFGAVAVFEQVRLLALSLFSSFVDPLGMLIRGGTMDDAWEGFVRGVREVKMGWQNKTSDDAWAKYAEDIGTVDASAYLDALGQTYSSLYMHGKLKKISDGLFKWNGMEAWNRAMRIQATKAAAGFIESHLKTPTEHSKRYLKELSLAADGDYMKNGQLDLQNEQVQRAIVRWTNGAILRPNAMQRPIYASDPHYALFYQLKQFTYSFHKTILRRAFVEAKHGNFMPATAMFATYVPMMIAADVVKALLTPGEEPAWMKQGLGAYVEHGVMRANLMGVPQFGVEMLDGVSLTDPLKSIDKATRILGPAPEHVVDWMMVPLSEEKTFGRELVRSAPGMTVYSRAVLD